MNDSTRGAIRHLIPIVVGLIVGQLAKYNIQDVNGELTALITSIVAGAYATIANCLEGRHKRFDRVLGVKGKPTYPPKPIRQFPTSEPLSSQK
jgi:hypothetical protein